MVHMHRVLPAPTGVEVLRNGDRMSAEQFHRVYLTTPESFRAELVAGVVFIASAVGYDHAVCHADLSGIICLYSSVTPGIQSGVSATVRLGPDGEPQPDLFLRIVSENGGQSSVVDNYIVGAPELVAEVAYSSWSIDLGDKYDDYRRHGVLEYLVLDLNERKLHLFDLKADKEVASDDGVLRPRQFPGLWLNSAAILAGDFLAMRATLDAGLASQEHVEFVQRLAEASTKKTSD